MKLGPDQLAHHLDALLKALVQSRLLGRVELFFGVKMVMRVNGYGSLKAMVIMGSILPNIEGRGRLPHKLKILPQIMLPTPN